MNTIREVALQTPSGELEISSTEALLGELVSTVRLTRSA